MAETILSNKILGIISGVGLDNRDGKWYTHSSFGRIVNLIGPRFKQVIYCAKKYPKHNESMDCELDSRYIEIRPGPFFAHTTDALKRPMPLLKSYGVMVRESDVIFLRGNMPYAWYIHLLCAIKHKPIIHWLVGNPIKLMQMEVRYGGLKDRLGLIYIRVDQMLVKLMMCFSKPGLLVNGDELGGIWSRYKPKVVVSTSISLDEFKKKEDTCIGDEIRLLFVGFIRPEKGLEYLVRALPKIKSGKKIKLSIVGSSGGYSAEEIKIKKIIEELKLNDIISWEGYARFGEELFRYIDASDIMVLPTLSEGTPRVLVEARARCLPVVSTNAGGIPTSVHNGKDGLLVEPKDENGLAEAISRIINDGEFRRELIHTGYERMKELSVETFSEKFIDSIAEVSARNKV